MQFILQLISPAALGIEKNKYVTVVPHIATATYQAEAATVTVEYLIWLIVYIV